MESIPPAGATDLAGLWAAEPGYLNTASYGLPPTRAWDAMQAALADWRAGRTSWEGWGESTERARESYARLIGVDAADVAVGAQVSQLLAPVAAAVPDGATVLVPELEFTSNVFPWAVHADRGVTVRTAPPAQLADRVDAGVDVVAFSLVQSSDGAVADYARIAAAARAAGALVVVDATQGCGWLPFDGALADVVVTGAYKWLMSPRGTGFAYLAPAARERLRPLAANWFAGEDVHSSYYGLPLRLAKNARAFDISPAWHAWVGTAPALELIEEIGVAAIHAHNVGLANRFLAGLGQEHQRGLAGLGQEHQRGLAGLGQEHQRGPAGLGQEQRRDSGLPAGGSAIVTVDVPGADERLAAAGIRAAVRNGRVRASFHVYTTQADVDAALNALVG